MAKYSKESLEKLLLLIDEICNEEENLWFKEKVRYSDFINCQNQISYKNTLSKIYEFCIRDIISKQANKFYEDFKIEEIKTKLIDDFIRMEHFRREDNFEDFCLAMFQQLEYIVNYIFNAFNLEKKLIEEANLRAISIYSKDEKKFIKANNGTYLSNFIFQFYKPNELIDLNISKYYFNNKLRSVLYYFYFNQMIEFNTNKFEEVYSIGYNLYQIRNLNHRGGEKNENQKKIIDDILPNHNKYYFIFLGFLEGFVSNINKNIKTTH